MISRLRAHLNPNLPPLQLPQPPLRKTPPDFCLVMIVRDEAPVIRRCLDSVVNFVDCYVICDTGSTDDTMQIISDYFQEPAHARPGYLYQKEWVNFGVNKSHVLETAFTEGKSMGAKYLFWLDADEVYQTPTGQTPSAEDVNALVSKLDSMSNVGIFYYMTHYGDTRYYRWQMVRNDQLYVWKQPVHEYLEATRKGTPSRHLSDLIVLARKEGNSSRDPRRKETDIKMFEDFLKENPDEPRATFYLAQSYMEGGQLDKCIEVYLKRTTLTGFAQERFISKLRVGRIYKKRGELDKALEILQSAIKEFPNRLEAWLEAIHVLRQQKNVKDAFKLAATAPQDQKPDMNMLFCEDSVYSYTFLLEASVTAFYAGQYETAISWGRKLLRERTFPSEDKKKLAESNLKFFLQKRPTAAATNILVVDNFLEEPDAVRDFALKQPFTVKGNYPGVRTESFATDAMKERIEKLLGRKIKFWPKGYNGAYQLATSGPLSWIHRDKTDYAGVLYLTPDAPSTSGTTFYRHKKLAVETENELNQSLLDQDSNDWSKWEVMDTVANRYNRLVLFNGRRSHMSGPYFGDSPETGRLFQLFFFNLADA